MAKVFTKELDLSYKGRKQTKPEWFKRHWKVKPHDPLLDPSGAPQHKAVPDDCDRSLAVCTFGCLFCIGQASKEKVKIVLPVVLP